MGKSIRIQLSAGACLLPAIALMFLPIQWVFAMIVAAGVHEFCHIAAIDLLNGHVLSISVGIRGAVIETEPMPASKELICALAGPVGSAALLLLARWFPRLAICGAVHCLYNLLPLFPFDGGRVLQSILSLLFAPHRSAWIWEHSQKLIRLLLIGLTVFFAVKFGWVVLLFAIVLLKDARRKTSCQQTLLEIQ